LISNFYCVSNNVNIRYDEYVSPTKLSELMATLQKDNLYVIHFNVRSLSRNLNKFEEFLNDMSRLPDAIAISETKLSSNSSTNINIFNYDFVHNDSPTCVGVYIKDLLQFRLQNDLSLNLTK